MIHIKVTLNRNEDSVRIQMDSNENGEVDKTITFKNSLQFIQIKELIDTLLQVLMIEYSPIAVTMYEVNEDNFTEIGEW